MLKKNRQQRFLKKNTKVWEKELQRFGVSQDAGALHQLRIAIKKIKAFARLSAACSDDHAKKDSNLLKKMFKQAGAIRDAGNHLELLGHFHEAPEDYKKEQHQLRAVATGQFVQDLGEYQKLGEKARRRLGADIHAIRTGCIKDWYGEQIIKIGVLLTASGDRLHKARRLIKQLIYVLKVLPEDLAKELNLDRDYLDQLQEAIGKWHDAAIVVAGWAGKDQASSQAMVSECHQRLTEVRTLAGDFYLRVHLQ
jgi:CHAD domain-containing protein